MRCPLNLDLFDTTLQVKSYPYTVDDHQHYMASLDFKESAASVGINKSRCACNFNTITEQICFWNKNCSLLSSHRKTRNNLQLLYFRSAQMSKGNRVSTIYRFGKRKHPDNKSIIPENDYTLTANVQKRYRVGV